jgi:hypothetical protein
MFIWRQKTRHNLVFSPKAAVAYPFGPDWRSNGPVWFEMGHTLQLRQIAMHTVAQN